jgi:hypothetical protein
MSKKRGWERPKLKTVISPLAAITLMAQEVLLIKLVSKEGVCIAQSLVHLHLKQPPFYTIRVCSNILIIRKTSFSWLFYNGPKKLSVCS